MIKRNYMIVIIIIALCISFLVVCTVVAFKTYSRSFGRVEGHRDNGFYSSITWKEVDKIKYSREEFHFYSGKNELQGFIYGGTNDKGLVVISHGLGGTADSYLSLIMHFADNGWRVFAFNNTGVSGSEGKGTRGLYQSALDLDAALTYIENTSALKDMPVMLAGHSWGGFAVCAVLNYDHNIKAAVSFAGYNSGIEVLKEQGLSTIGGIYYTVIPQMLVLQRLLFGKAAALTAVDGINKAGIPVMIVQSSDDNLVFADSSSIYAHRKEITNPHVEIIYREADDAAGHDSVFYSKNQKEYLNRTDKSWETYKTKHSNASRAEWAKEINFDKALANELDDRTMKRIEEFFSRAK